jgi:hypothetical protein
MDLVFFFCLSSDEGVLFKGMGGWSISIGVFDEISDADSNFSSIFSWSSCFFSESFMSEER